MRSILPFDAFSFWEQHHVGLAGTYLTALPAQGLVELENADANILICREDAKRIHAEGSGEARLWGRGIQVEVRLCFAWADRCARWRFSPTPLGYLVAVRAVFVLAFIGGYLSRRRGAADDERVASRIGPRSGTEVRDLVGRRGNREGERRLGDIGCDKALGRAGEGTYRAGEEAHLADLHRIHLDDALGRR